MGLYGLVADSTFKVQQYSQKQVGVVLDNSNVPPYPQTQEELDRRIDIMDHAKKNLDFANDVIQAVLDNISKLQL